MTTNIHDVLFGSHDQEVFHTRMLAFLCDPAGAHGMGRTFLDALLEGSGLSGFEFKGKDMYVKDQFPLGKGNHPDVAIMDEGSLVLIEAKIRLTSTTEGQVERYASEAREKAGGRRMGLIYLLPGKKKDYGIGAELPPDAVLMSWETVLETLGTLIEAQPPMAPWDRDLATYCDYASRAFGSGVGHAALTEASARHSRSRAGVSESGGSFAMCRTEFLRDLQKLCGHDTKLLGAAYAVVGFIETHPLLRIQYKKGNTNWTLTGSIPRKEGVTLIMGMYAKGRAWVEFRRLPDDLIERFKQLTGFQGAGGWKEFDVNNVDIGNMLGAVATILEEIRGRDMPPVR